MNLLQMYISQLKMETFQVRVISSFPSSFLTLFTISLFIYAVNFKNFSSLKPPFINKALSINFKNYPSIISHFFYKKGTDY